VAETYGQLRTWRLKYMPWLLEPGGAAIIFRLRERRMGARCAPATCIAEPGLHRLRCSRHSPNSGERGWLPLCPEDGRRQLVEATDLLRRLARCYVQTMGHLLL
jgi:hypothetical protein